MAYYNATICNNGHIISVREANATKFCEKCGSKTFSFCPSCNAPIKGDYICTEIISLYKPTLKEYYCYECGEPYPWTQNVLSRISDILSYDEKIELTDKAKEIIKDALPLLITDSIETDYAVSKFKMVLKNASSETMKLLSDLVRGVFCAAALQKLGLA